MADSGTGGGENGEKEKGSNQGDPNRIVVTLRNLTGDEEIHLTQQQWDALLNIMLLYPGIFIFSVEYH